MDGRFFSLDKKVPTPREWYGVKWPSPSAILSAEPLPSNLFDSNGAFYTWGIESPRQSKVYSYSKDDQFGWETLFDIPTQTCNPNNLPS